MVNRIFFLGDIHKHPHTRSLRLYVAGPLFKSRRRPWCHVTHVTLKDRDAFRRRCRRRNFVLLPVNSQQTAFAVITKAWRPTGISSGIGDTDTKPIPLDISSLISHRWCKIFHLSLVTISSKNLQVVIHVSRNFSMHFQHLPTENVTAKSHIILHLQ